MNTLHQVNGKAENCHKLISAHTQKYSSVRGSDKQCEHTIITLQSVFCCLDWTIWIISLLFTHMSLHTVVGVLLQYRCSLPIPLRCEPKSEVGC